MIQERQYQREALESILQGFEGGESRQLLVLPTGAGKTITFSQVISAYVRAGKRCLVLAHREELLAQAQNKLFVAEGLFSELERADNRAPLGADVVVGSVQTMYRKKRLHRWPDTHFDLIIVDEAHRTLAPTYQKILNYFWSADVLGVTATPDRADKRNLGQFFGNIAYEVGLKQMIEQGFLAPIRVKTFPIDLDMSKVRTKMGEFDANDVGRELEPLLEPIADAFVREIQGRNRSLVFLPLCDISRQFTEILKGRGISAEHIDGESKNRSEILTRYREGEISVLCNAMLLTEGYDEPIIDTIMCLRPTKSRGLYSQIIGRGTRVHPEKKYLLVLDPLWMSETHTLVKPAHLIAETAEDAAEATEVLRQADFIPDVEDESMDLLEMVSSATESRLEKIAARLREKQKIAAKKFDPITYAMQVMESPAMVEYSPAMKWEADRPTEKQLELLEKEGFSRDEITCKGHASKLLDMVFHRRQMGLATTKQLFHLHKMGVPNANALTMDEASAELGRRWGNKATYKKAV